ncbi:MAG: hypothetical protein COV52_09735 [Gammaproteobacteria bacterium CG11_big_fil_rev_8_21_14_0_20_46_22]|nr:MAG: hypothetical protein COV52_09735 [Gammaproteobacteria bacterium CG11_big_fil_rev_8_21_14_0_20_46_22]
MSDKQDEMNSAVDQKPPKGVGISPKLFITVVMGLAILFLFVLIMIFSYRGKGHTVEPQKQNTLVNQQNGVSAEAAINQLNRDTSDGVLVHQKQQAQKQPEQQNQNVPQTIVQSPPNDQNALQAARSNISVVNNYHGPTGQALMGQGGTGAYSGGINGLANQENQLNAMAQSALSGLGQSGNYKQQNMQSEKTAFLQSASQKDNKFYLNSKLTKPISPFEVKAGTIIPATLLTGIDSDLPGEITAQVSQNVYDTVTGNYLLIPQGTRIIGAYDSKVAYGQSRILIAWSRLIYPDGDSFDLEGQPGVDLMGMAGLHDLVDNHYTRIFGSALMFSMFGALGQLSQPQQANGILTNQQIIYGAIGQQMSQTGAQLVEKNINIQPTLKIRPGANFNILLTRDMVLPGPYRSQHHIGLPYPSTTSNEYVK